MAPPAEKEKFNHLFCDFTYVDHKDGTMYTDLTGKFPIRSMVGMTAVFVLYDWTLNAILVTPITDATDATMVEAFKQTIEYLGKRGFKPKFNVMDNVASKAIKSYLTDAEVGLQLIEPHNHRVNAAERAIQTFKNHFIAGLSIGDERFPTMLWSKLIKQAQHSLNLLCTTRVHLKISAYHALEGTHDFKRHPFAPPATRATIFNPSKT